MNFKVNFANRKIICGKPEGNLCRDVPNAGTDGKGTIFVTYAMSILDKSDVYAGSYIMKSVDYGKTFEAPKMLHIPTHTPDGTRFTFRDCVIYHNKKHDKWLSLGCVMEYDKNDDNIRKNGIIIAKPVFTTINPEKCDYEGPVNELPFPYDYISVFVNAQPIEFDNGDVLLSFYYITENCHKAASVSVLYSYDGEKFNIVKAGKPIDGSNYARGIIEPSIAKLKDKYYITLRTDEMGMFATSDDGFTFGTPKPWRFDNGDLIGNYNTQQHWVRFKDALYLVYNRKGANNDHILRHRAPVFMARFDETKECLIKDSEVVLIPEKGAQMGNFVVLDMDDTHALHINCECMQSGRACDDVWQDVARFGADNAVWAVDIELTADKT